MAQPTRSPATQGWGSRARGQKVGLALSCQGSCGLVGVGIKGLVFQTFMAGPASPR